MNTLKIYLFIILSLFVFTTNSQEKKENPFIVKWANGLKIESADKQFKLKIGGRIMYDMGYFSLNDTANSNGYSLKSTNGSEFRRARLFSSGTLYDNIDYKLQVDFSGGKTTLKDAFIVIKKIPVVGNFIVGHFKEPHRLESLTSSKYITFMERALPISFIPERNTGFMLFNEIANQRMSWQIGLFGDAQKSSSDNPQENGSYALTTRVAGTAINKPNILLHLGVSQSYRKPQENKKFEYSVRPEVHISEKYLEVNVDGVNYIHLLNLETALVAKSFSLQGEYSVVNVKSTVENERFNSFYTQISYFLTGEKRKYKNSLMGFGRVKPTNNFGKEGMGAIELAFRYSSIDGINNDNMGNISAGINWYLNPATRIMANYVVSDIDNNTQFTGKGRFNAFQMRFQIDF